MADVMPVAEARAGLSSLLADFRSNEDLEVVVIGSHRRPEAALVPYRRYRELADGNTTPPVTLGRLRELSGVIARLAAASHLTDVRVYGSVAHGDAAAGSDLDLLVTPSEDATLFDLAQFEMDLEAILGVEVSVTSASALDPEKDRGILADAVAVCSGAR